MKEYIFKLIIFTLPILIFSCNENDLEINDFKGYYKIISISSNLEIDLNNDGLKSLDYLKEIKSDYISYNGEIYNYNYNNELEQNFAEARPTTEQSNNTQFLDIRFPIQRIDSIFQGGNNFVKTNMEYRRMHTAFIYEINQNNIEIKSDPFNEFEFYGINNFNINRINKIEFEVTFNFKVYDFKENEWIETELKTKYEKVGK